MTKTRIAQVAALLAAIRETRSPSHEEFCRVVQGASAVLALRASDIAHICGVNLEVAKQWLTGDYSPMDDVRGAMLVPLENEALRWLDECGRNISLTIDRLLHMGGKRFEGSEKEGAPKPLKKKARRHIAKITTAFELRADAFRATGRKDAFDFSDEDIAWIKAQEEKRKLRAAAA
jgi:hypothetical protein